eukprot:m.16473 g.16473  ORF g.16473 m.16473 type:complete len:669 (-) comp5258_c0_seq2:215-2221(-)
MALWTGVALAFLALAGARAATPPKVIILMLADDYGYNNVGFAHGPLNGGNPEMKTPNIDKLAMEGIRLERHYVYEYCSPTRSALMSGRVPIHVNQNNDCNSVTSDSGVDLRMTMLPAKLKAKNWATAMVGKWHLGARSPSNLPINRGFDTHLGFLKGGEDHFHQDHCAGGPDRERVDLWHNEAPARTYNGTYSAYMYSDYAIKVIQNFSAGKMDGEQLFMYLAWHDTHEPLEAPPRYFYPPLYKDNTATRLTYNAMARALDEAVGNVTSALQRANLWDQSLILWSADNGGWLVPGGGSSNYPLRGGKTTDFEGGVRSVAFVAGGYLPSNVKGSVYSGLVSVADWYATVSKLAGVDPSDPAQGVPPIDSLDVWDDLVVFNNTVSSRTSLPLSWQCKQADPAQCFGNDPSFKGALINGTYKIIYNPSVADWWQGPVFPNASGIAKNGDACKDGCLFDIYNDPTEHVNLKSAQPQKFAAMKQLLLAAGRSTYQTSYADPAANECITDPQAKKYFGNFIGPRCFKHSPVPPAPPPSPPFSLSHGDTCLMATHNSSTTTHMLAFGPCTAASGHWRSETMDNFLVWNNTEVLYLKLNERPDKTHSTLPDFCRRGEVYLNPDKGQGKTLQGFVYDSKSRTLNSSICESRCLAADELKVVKCGTDATDKGWQPIPP